MFKLFSNLLLGLSLFVCLSSELQATETYKMILAKDNIWISKLENGVLTPIGRIATSGGTYEFYCMDNGLLLSFDGIRFSGRILGTNTYNFGIWHWNDLYLNNLNPSLAQLDMAGGLSVSGRPLSNLSLTTSTRTVDNQPVTTYGAQLELNTARAILETEEESHILIMLAAVKLFDFYRQISRLDCPNCNPRLTQDNLQDFATTQHQATNQVQLQVDTNGRIQVSLGQANIGLITCMNSLLLGRRCVLTFDNQEQLSFDGRTISGRVLDGSYLNFGFLNSNSLYRNNQDPAIAVQNGQGGLSQNGQPLYNLVSTTSTSFAQNQWLTNFGALIDIHNDTSLGRWEIILLVAWDLFQFQARAQTTTCQCDNGDDEPQTASEVVIGAAISAFSGK